MNTFESRRSPDVREHFTEGNPVGVRNKAVHIFHIGPHHWFNQIVQAVPKTTAQMIMALLLAKCFYAKLFIRERRIAKRSLPLLKGEKSLVYRDYLRALPMKTKHLASLCKLNISSINSISQSSKYVNSALSFIAFYFTLLGSVKRD